MYEALRDAEIAAEGVREGIRRETWPRHNKDLRRQPNPHDAGANYQATIAASTIVG